MKYSQELKDFIYANYKGIGNKELSKMIKDKFGVDIPFKRLASWKKNNNLNSGLTGYFEKGHLSFNKGMKQTDYMSLDAIERTLATRFQKGNIPKNYVSVGTELMKADGYTWVKIADPNKWKQKHRVIWEKHHGRKLKDGELVTFLDGDVNNFNINNLMLIDKKESVILNSRGLRNEDKDITKANILITRLDFKIKEK